jgi:hypothetical protein
MKGDEPGAEWWLTNTHHLRYLLSSPYLLLLHGAPLYRVLKMQRCSARFLSLTRHKPSADTILTPVSWLLTAFSRVNLLIHSVTCGRVCLTLIEEQM